MYGKIKLCPFVLVMGPVITEAPTNFTPISDDDGESLKATDLTKKQDDDDISEDTITGNESDSQIEKNIDSLELSLKGKDTVLESPPDDIVTNSGTPSESLLSPSVQFNEELDSISGTNMKHMSNRNTPNNLNNEGYYVSPDSVDPTSMIYPPSDGMYPASVNINIISLVPNCDINTDRTNMKNIQEITNTNEQIVLLLI